MENNKCKFQIFIIKGPWKGTFLCAAMVDGWAYTWSSNPQSAQYPCEGCKKYIPGKSTEVDHWLKSDEFWKLSGQIILEKDWEHWKKEGVNK